MRLCSSDRTIDKLFNNNCVNFEKDKINLHRPILKSKIPFFGLTSSRFINGGKRFQSNRKRRRYIQMSHVFY
jgi:hypothetical protein